MRNRVIGGILFSVGILVVLTPRYILPVCEYQGFKAMTCSHTGTAEMFMGFILMAASAGMFASKEKEALRWASLTSFAVGTSVLAIPEAIGHCHSGGMPCNYGTVPALRLMGAVVCLASLSGLLLSFRKGKDSQ